MSYLVIRLVPDSAVDAATFATYLDDLQIKVYQANTELELGSTPRNAPPIVLTPLPGPGFPGVDVPFIASVSKQTAGDTPAKNPHDPKTNYGRTLQFADTSGIAVGSHLYNAANVNKPNQAGFPNGARIIDVKEQSVTIDQDIAKYLPAGTICSFVSYYSNPVPPDLSVSVAINDKANKGSKTLPFKDKTTDGICCKMVVSGAAGIDSDTTVVEVTENSVTLSKSLTEDILKDTQITFSYAGVFSETGIVQHIEETTVTAPLSWWSYPLYTLTSVATALIPLNLPSPAPTYLNITVEAQRQIPVLGSNPTTYTIQNIPVNNDFYNVQYVNTSLPHSSQPQFPFQYPDIPVEQTSLYITLPAPPITTAINLTIPNDGTPPNFKELYHAMAQVLNPSNPNDPGIINTIANLIQQDQTQSRLLAYEIVWSQQNTLPTPPDPLEELYTNPPNTGGSGNDSNGQNDEQDRQKFEGTLSSFYATRNAKAEHLTKFVAAVSAAVYCELKSIKATQAILTFPVDPPQPSDPTSPSSWLASSQVYAELLIQGLSPDNGTSFGVPAAFFYALGANMDKSTKPDRRYQIACGDAIERILQEIGTAVAANAIGTATAVNTINDTESFVSLPAAPPINSAQAARRLSALSVSSASDSPKILLPPTGPSSWQPIVQIVQAWLEQPSLSFVSSIAPPQKNTYQIYEIYQTGFENQIWSTIAINNQQGYLNLVLAALTQGYLIPSAGPLADKISELLSTLVPNPTVETLKGLPVSEWTRFFTPNPSWLPPFVRPGIQPAADSSPTPKAGNISTCIQAFIRAVQKFFTVSSVPNTRNPASPELPPTFDLPSLDVIAQAATAYSNTFQFGSGPLDDSQLTTAVQIVFPDDKAAQTWLKDAFKTINELYQIAKVVQNIAPNVPASLSFSIVEALYARGFKSAKDITDLSQPDFQEALVGTVAYPYAITTVSPATTSLYQEAQRVQEAQGITPSPISIGQGDEPFHPINSDGLLTNCVPPEYLSPLGPIAYLKDMLNLYEKSTCENLDKTLDAVTLKMLVGQRRGALGDLLVSRANLETQLPLIDIVNENLEHLVAMLPADSLQGAVYNTASDQVANHVLCTPTSENSDSCNVPDQLFEVLPQYSSPAVPVSQPTAYDKLKLDFSSPALPYSQPLDICRTYLEHFATCRYAAMRTFRKEITEFALDPTLPAPEFQSHLWRYPVRIDTAIEYLKINPEEYDLLFTKDIKESDDGGDVDKPEQLVLYELYGFSSAFPKDTNWIKIVLWLPEFLKRTGLTYCELVELQKSRCFPFVVVKRDRDLLSGGNSLNESSDKNLPDCEPCCLEDYLIRFTSPEDQILENPKEVLRKLAVFLRLWHKLQTVCGACYTFTQLCDICEVLQLFAGTSINPDFIRQLAAFQILKNQLQLQLTDGTNTTGTRDARTHILSLWVGSSAVKWNWAVEHLVDRIQHVAEKERCHSRTPHFIKLLIENLDPLSILIGFNPEAPHTDTWYAKPTHTLRFAEVLTKICKSHFGVGELLYLFTADEHLDGDDPFPLQDSNEALDNPLELPDDDDVHSLWALRQKLLTIEVTEEEACKWNWQRIDTVLRQEFGYEASSGSTDTQAHDYLLSLGQHFFPNTLECAGIPVSKVDRQYRVDLAVASTSPNMWNIPQDGSFHYNSTAQQPKLWTQLPLCDKAVVEKLEHLRDLNPDERSAVQNLYFMPRVDLAPFACFFPNFAAAERHLIEEPDEEKRWHWFRYHFALAYKRCQVIAEHLVEHVASATDFEWKHGRATVWLVLKRLFADENLAQSSWEKDSGAMPDLTWKPLPSGGAFAALLGLAGTGLLGEFRRSNSTLAWREVRGPLNAFGYEKNKHNSPVPTVLPAMDLVPSTDQLRFIELRNGFAIQDHHGRELGGAESFTVRWTGVLLVNQEGHYEFLASIPTPHGEEPDHECVERCRWRVTLNRGQKTWVVLCHQWLGEHREVETSLSLKSGAYNIVVEFVQPPPDFSDWDDFHPQHTGFQVKYAGPDTGGCTEILPLQQLYRNSKVNTFNAPSAPDASNPLFPESSSAGEFLKLYYTSSLRDIRRTYQRAFKALLFVHRFELSGELLMAYGQSELGYMLDNAGLFAGVSYFRNSSSFSRHTANFDFNFLPLKDQYNPPSPSQDQRVQPSFQRKQALFDWWERIFDYTHMRHERQRAIERPVWLLFEEASEKQPDNPAQLLRHLEVDLRHATLALNYFQNQATPIYSLTSSDLEDDRWAVRVWHSDQWIRHLLYHFNPKNIRAARPDLWVSDKPESLVPTSPTENEKQTGNENLSQFLCDGCFENGEPRRYTDVKLLNNQLRERARLALIAYLCGMDRVSLPAPWEGSATCARDLSDLLLIDVETGLCEKASRIEEAITAVQNFVRRTRLGLEEWSVPCEFSSLWDKRFANFRQWEACKRREIYRENWIDWSELEKARGIEAFQFLESELRSTSLTVAEPGGLAWWPNQHPPSHKGINSVETRQPASIQQLSLPPEGFDLLGTPEREVRPSWLATLAVDASGSDANRLRTNNPQAGLPADLPFWLEAAIRLGKRFVRIAAAGEPLASFGFKPHDSHASEKCCTECGQVHPALVDEYYFWLVDTQFFDAVKVHSNSAGGTDTFHPSFQFGFQDSYYDKAQQQSAEWNDDESQVPQLLYWPPSPAVRLAWCRVHNGEFGQPRSSVGFIEVDSTQSHELQFLGRARDSLYFEVTNSISVTVSYQNPPNPGFRYDLPTDNAVILPPVVQPATASVPSLPGSLPAYPFFAYDVPGARLFPKSLFAPAIVVADTLRARCRFEAALNWYKLAYDPLKRDCTWVHCLETGNDREQPGEGRSTTAPGQSACCDSTKNITDEIARNRSITLHYCRTLLDWGDSLIRHRPSPETFQQARLIFNTVAKIMGNEPKTIRLDDSSLSSEFVGVNVGNFDFTLVFAPLNPKLLDLYTTLSDRLRLIHTCQNTRRLHNGCVNRDMNYFGDKLSSQNWQNGNEACLDETAWCYLHSPYRFTFLIQKARELAGKARELGSALLSAFEKGDAEFLASLRAGHERELLSLEIAIRQSQWRDADWQIQALQQTKQINQANLLYYSNMYQKGLINSEIQHQSFTTLAMQTRTSSNIVRAEGQIMKVIPDLFIGFPCTDTQIPLGTKLAGVFETISDIMGIFGDIQSQTAAIDLTLAGWQRRSDEWLHQTLTLPIEIEQIELQILGAQRRREQALDELNNQYRKIEQSREVLDFLRDKFTANNLYHWMQKETVALYSRLYELALDSARQAERAFNFERGHTNRHFIPNGIWDNLHEGMLAGERLEVALHHMEKAYCDENIREYELTKHLSLRQNFPVEFLRLRTTGYCEIDIPEWMFDQDFPGQYMRRIKNVSLTLPCVTGPYTGVHCRLTLISSVTRIDPRLIAPAHDCCCPPKTQCRGEEKSTEGYQLCPDDPRMVKFYGVREAIATSSGQNDSGMFELSFNDPRYLPFEYMGAVSRWRIELPPENNYFDLNSLTDTILHLNYTAREGGELLRNAAKASVRHKLPGDGWSFFDIRHDFPDAWERFRHSKAKEEHPIQELTVKISRKFFPFLPGEPEIRITKFVLLFETEEMFDHSCPDLDDCPCPEPKVSASHLVKFNIHHHQERDCEAKGFTCYATSKWPKLFSGMIDTDLHPFGKPDQKCNITFGFPREIGEIVHAYMFCHYEVVERCIMPKPFSRRVE